MARVRGLVKFIGDDSVAMVWGNILAGHGLKKRLKAAVENAETGKGAMVFGYYVDDPERLGIVDFYERSHAISIEENRSIRRATTALQGCIFTTTKLFVLQRN